MSSNPPPGIGALTLSEDVDLHRKRKGLDWADVAIGLGVSDATLYRWRANNFADARLTHLQALIDLLGLDADRVLTRTGAA